VKGTKNTNVLNVCNGWMCYLPWPLLIKRLAQSSNTWSLLAQKLMLIHSP